jgi:hypothetical protein
MQERFGTNTIKNNNIEIIAPEQDREAGREGADKYAYDFQTINEKIFGLLLQKVDSEEPLKTEELPDSKVED